MAATRRYLRTFRGFSPDARLFLLATIAYGAAYSLYWTDFNLYLQALGLGSVIGLVAATAQLAGAAVALPASVLSDRIGRRLVLAGGTGLMIAATAGFLAGSVPLLFASVALFGAGSQTVQSVQVPFMAEHTKREHRNEYFAIQAAITYFTNFAAAMIGGRAAVWLAGQFALPAATGPYRVLLVAMVALFGVAALVMLRLPDDRPRRAAGAASGASARSWLGAPIADRGQFARLLLPGFIISLGAGQVIPFLNVFVKGKFDLDLTSLNDIFAVTSLGTALAIVLQPALATRFGKVASVVLVQAASIPFIVVLGFSPLLWTVIVALAVRNSLMNAGNPIYNAFAMEQLRPAERARYSAMGNVLWSLGWAIAGPYYYFFQQTLGFHAGYAVDFGTIILLYTLATVLMWRWFGPAERRSREAARAVPPPLPTA